MYRYEWGEGGREGCRLPLREQMLLWRSGRGEKGESLTSGGLREGGGVSERTLIRPLGHT